MSEARPPADQNGGITATRYKEVREPLGLMGLISRIGFWAWQALMLVWFLSFSGEAGELARQAGSDWERAGAGVGTAIGWGVILFVWVGGSVIFGLMALLTRPTRMLVPDDAPTVAVAPGLAPTEARSSPTSYGPDQNRKQGSMGAVIILGVFLLAGLTWKAIKPSPSVPRIEKAEATVVQAKPARDEVAAPATKKKCQVGLEQYDDLKMGLSLEEIERRFACKGSTMSEVELGSYGTTRMVTWGGAKPFSQVVLTFHNSRLQSKSQFGLD